MDGGEEEKADNSNPGLSRQLCRFFSQGRHCNFGTKCKFLHVRDDAITQEMETIKNAKTSTASDGDGGNVEHKTNPTSSRRFAPAANRPCRYFLSGHCAMEDRCRFWHPSELLSTADPAGRSHHAPPAQRMAAVPRPGVAHEVKLSELTEDVARRLRETEIEQLKKRIPKEQLIIQEQDGLAYYRATVEATDPDWVECFHLFEFNQSRQTGRGSVP